MVYHWPVNQAFLREQVITYLGNKRKLISFIDSLIDELLSTINRAVPRWLDAFSGSGIVSRYAREKGFEVWANDIEVYSQPINAAFLCIKEEDLDTIFSPVAAALSLSSNEPAYKAVLDYLNSLNHPIEEYFAKHYAPADTGHPDFENERLFYTRENALRIDAMLEVIHNSEICTEQARNILLAGLLYNMSKHINTSGIMKGFHKGWGGRGGHALSRILAPIVLEPLPMSRGPKGHVLTGDAAEIGTDIEFDIVYADPPYNQHQYGANYHLLTSATLNDKYNPGPVERGSRAGIRVDHQRSAFCKKSGDNAIAAFTRFVRNINTRYLLVSYNNEGIISGKDMLAILSNDLQNRVEIRTFTHEKFKGGKNTQNSTRTLEFLFLCEMGIKQSEKNFNETLEYLDNLVNELRLKESYIDIHSAAEALDLQLHCSKRRYFLSRNSTVILEVNADFRIVSLTPKGLLSVAELEAFLIDKIMRMKLYISGQEYSRAIRLLPSFKIKKYSKEFRLFSEQLQKADLSQAQRSKLDKMCTMVLQA